jgi:hypothetical protein
MNEPASFCFYPCRDPEDAARRRGVPPTPPPVRGAPRPIPGFNITSADMDPSGVDPVDTWVFGTVESTYPGEVQRPIDRRNYLATEAVGDDLQVPIAESALSFYPRSSQNDVIDPPYKIANSAGRLNDLTVHTNVKHYNGLLQYDTHNLYGHSRLLPSPRSDPSLLFDHSDGHRYARGHAAKTSRAKTVHSCEKHFRRRRSLRAKVARRQRRTMVPLVRGTSFTVRFGLNKDSFWQCPLQPLLYCWSLRLCVYFPVTYGGK